MCWIQSHTEQRLILDTAGRSLVRMDLSYRSTVPVYSTGRDQQQNLAVLRQYFDRFRYQSTVVVLSSSTRTTVHRLQVRTAVQLSHRTEQEHSILVDSWMLGTSEQPGCLSARRMSRPSSTLLLRSTSRTRRRRSQLSEAPRQKFLPTLPHLGGVQ